MRERVAIGLTVMNLALLGFQLVGQPRVEAQTTTDVLRARALQLVDERGTSRASLDVAPQGDVVFRLRDESGTIRVKMSAGRGGSGLLLLDSETEPGVQLDAGTGGSRLRLTNRGGRTREVTP